MMKVWCMLKKIFRNNKASLIKTKVPWRSMQVLKVKWKLSVG